MGFDLSLKLEPDDEEHREEELEEKNNNEQKQDEDEEEEEEGEEEAEEATHEDKEDSPPSSRIRKEEDEREELLQLQMEMERVKEENTRLRKLVDQKLQDYRHLEMKFPVTDQTNNKDLQAFLRPQGFCSLDISRGRKRIAERSPMMSPEDGGGEGDLGLSLSLQASAKLEEAEERKDHKSKEVEVVGGCAVVESNQQTYSSSLQRNDSNASRLVASSPANRKARVSVRARCETATVSLTDQYPNLSPFGPPSFL